MTVLKPKPVVSITGHRTSYTNIITQMISLSTGPVILLHKFPTSYVTSGSGWRDETMQNFIKVVCNQHGIETRTEDLTVYTTSSPNFPGNEWHLTIPLKGDIPSNLFSEYNYNASSPFVTPVDCFGETIFNALNCDQMVHTHTGRSELKFYQLIAKIGSTLLF